MAHMQKKRGSLQKPDLVGLSPGLERVRRDARAFPLYRVARQVGRSDRGAGESRR